MKTISMCGLAATIIVLGVIIWTLQSALMLLAWCCIGFGSTWILISLWRHLMPAVESTVKTHMAVKQASHEQWKDIVSVSLQERVLSYVERNHLNVELAGNGTIAASYPVATRVTVPPALPKTDSPQQEELPIPAHVRYEDIQSYIPKDHVLIGVGEGGKIDTREKEVKGLIWIPGSSGAGKSNTTGLRVEEDFERGHKFLGIDPHFFKADSLSNLVKPYMSSFIEPMAHTDKSTLHILDYWIAEVERRKAGGVCWPLTLLIDEIGSLTADKPEDDTEKEMIAKIKKCVRQAGQETRGFNMNLIAISQDAAGLAWLRKRALLVIGHKVTMMSERDLVCNERSDIARQMDEWPVGRTVVYGVALQGIFVRQQPLFTVPRTTGTLYNSPTVPDMRSYAFREPTEPLGVDVPLVPPAQQDFAPEHEKISSEEREQIIELARNGTPRRLICQGLGKGKWYYEIVKTVLDEEGL